MAEVSIPLKESQGVLVHTRPQPKLIDRVVLAPGVHCKQKLDGRVVVGGQIVAGVGTADSEAARTGATTASESCGRPRGCCRESAAWQWNA